MQPLICGDISNYSFFRKVFYLVSSISVAEVLTYPLDRIKTLLFAKNIYLTASPFGYKELHLTTQEILNFKKFFGLFYGLKVGFDRNFSFLLPKFFSFYYLMNLKKSEKLSIFQLFGFSLTAHTLSGLILQTSNVLKIKIQSEPILPSNASKIDAISLKYRAVSEIYSKDHLLIFRCGLGSSLLSLNILGMTELFGFLFIKRCCDDRLSLSEINKTVISVVLASVLATGIANPFEFIHHKIVLTELKGSKIENLGMFTKQLLKKSGVSIFYQGFLPNLLRNCFFNAILVTILLNVMAFEKRKAFLKTMEYQGRYSIEN